MEMRRAVLVLAACSAMVAGAQTVQVNDSSQPESVLYQGGELMVLETGGHWQQHSALREYAEAHKDLHGGDFVLFRGRDGAIHDLNDAQAVKALLTTYAPMKVLGEEQSALGRPQSSLGHEQAALGAQMRLSASPQEMAAIGHEQGAIGAVQGRIGEVQGDIGRKQGQIGQTGRAQLQQDIEHCQAAATCPAVARK